MVRRIAIVPARGGSKRIPRKNIRDFHGKPMIGYILEAARASGLFDVIHVSTEDDNVRSVAASLGFAPEFARPASLADDHTPIMPVLRYVVETYAGRGVFFDEIWMLMPCAPFIDAGDLQAAAGIVARDGAPQAVLAVAPYPVPIEWAYRREADGRLTPVQPGMFAVRSQDIEPKYFDTGTFAALPAAMVRVAEGAGSDQAFVGHVLPRDKAIDIDDEADWAFAESMYERLNRESE